jgi:hypothetical protein
VANKQDYIADLKSAILKMHGCQSVYLKTEHVHEVSQGKTAWLGEVEIFNLVNHPTAKHAYAWAHLEGEKNDATRYVAVLELPPVKDARTAVQASILANLKKGSFGRPH